MAIPTRLPVLLHNLKSAAAGAASPASNRQAVTTRRTVPEIAKLALIRPTGVIASRTSRRNRRAVNEDGAEVVDVREGRAGGEEIAQRLEKSGGVVVGKQRGRIQRKFARACHGLAIESRTGGILRRAFAAIRAVGIARERRDTAR